MSPDDNEEKLYIDGYDDAIMGYGNQYPRDDVVIYSKNKIIEKLLGSGLDIYEALEFFEAHIQNVYLGEGTPIICNDMAPGNETEREDDYA